MAFEQVPQTGINLENLNALIDVCETLVKDLRHISKVVCPTFPPQLDLLNLYIQAYERACMGYLNYYLESGESFFSAAPEAVLSFNKFV